MFLLTKTNLVLVYCLVISLSLVGQKTVIIESHSVYSNHTMDNRWLTKAQSFGLDAQINPYSFLDNKCLIDEADVIIVASSIMPITNMQMKNLAIFVESGGNLYLQGEWNYTLPGNLAFEKITNHFDDEFTWADSIKIQLAPISVEGPLANNYNNITDLSYFWSGAHAEFQGPFETILTKGANNYGLIYSPTQAHAGKVISISDQDWVRLELSNEFFENILKYLTEEFTPAPTVFIETEEDEYCIGTALHFNSEITGEDENLTYQWYLNGNAIPGANSADYVDINLVDGDVIECHISIANGCNKTLHISNPILIAPIMPLGQVDIELTVVQLDSCKEQIVNFQLLEDNPDNVEIISYEWVLNGFSLGNTNSDQLAIVDLNNNDAISCNFLINDPCDGQVWISTPIHTIKLYETITPELSFVTASNSFCAGEQPYFSIGGDGWGDDPQISWWIDGMLVQEGSIDFSIDNLITGQHTIEVTVESSVKCPSNDLVAQSIIFTIEEDVQMAAAITTDQLEVCEGEIVTFTIEGEYLGNDPTIIWKVDGVIQDETNEVFHSDEYKSGLIITAEIISAHPCIENGILELVAPEVSVIQISTPNIAIDANPMKVCPGSEVTLQASGNYLGDSPQIEWYLNGDLAEFGGLGYNFTPEANSLVQVRIVSNYICVENPVVVSELLEIEVSDIEVALLSSTAEHCNQQDGAISLQVNGGIGTTSGQWTDGNTALSLTNLTAGNYSFLAVDEIGCESSLSLELAFEGAPEIDEVLVQQPDCDEPLGQAELLMPTASSAYDIIWMNAQLEEVDQGAIASGLTGGSYLVEVIDAFGCLAEASIDIATLETVQLATAPLIEIELGESVTLEPLVFSDKDNLTYEWSSFAELGCIDCNTLEEQPKESTKYQLTVTNDFGCSATTEFQVRVKKDYDIFMPNAFSPNADGHNDHYMVFGGIQVAAIKSLSIFNRWGERVFEAKNPMPGAAEDGWNGMYMGKLAPVGTYVVMAEVSYADGEERILTSDMQLLR